jgi:integrase
VEGKAGLGGARKMSVDEFWRAYEAAGLRPRVGTKLQVTLALGLATWLRLEALLNLQVTWIDGAEATVTVPREFMKGGKAELTLPLNRFAMASIQRATIAFPKAIYVLPVNPATHRPATNLFHTLRAIAADADMRPFSLHSIRKTAASLILNHRCDYCRNCRMFLADHKRERCANGETTFFATHSAGVRKIVADTILAHAMPQMDTAYFEVDLETMRDALSVIDEEWERYNRRSEGKIIEIAARRA